MATTVHAAFEQFLENINLPGDHRTTATARRNHIVGILEKEFEVLEAFPIGSIPAFTGLRNLADVDVLVALHYTKHIKGKAPSQVLQMVRTALAEYRTGARKNGQAVTVNYTTWPNVDIVPAARVTTGVFEIGDANREVWMSTTPQSHLNTLSSRSTSMGPPFLKAIKMAKHWNEKHSQYLQSFHIEVMALQAFTGYMGTDMTWNMYSYFKSAATAIQSTLAYEGQFIDSYLTYQDRQAAAKRLMSARDTGLSAWSATYGSSNDHKTAITLWRQVFGDSFPAYG